MCFFVELRYHSRVYSGGGSSDGDGWVFAMVACEAPIFRRGVICALMHNLLVSMKSTKIYCIYRFLV